MRNERLIFGREPALWLAAFQAVLAVLVGFQWDGLTAEQAALWLAAANALIGAAMAWFTRPIAPGVYASAFSVVATLVSAYGFHISPEIVGAVNGAIIVIITLMVRGHVSPTPLVPLDPLPQGRRPISGGY